MTAPWTTTQWTPEAGVARVRTLWDFFERGAPEGWVPSSVSFMRELGKVKLGDTVWRVRAFVCADRVRGEEFAVHVEYGSIAGSARGPRNRAFVAAVEEKLSRVGYEVGGNLGYKEVPFNDEALRAELAILAALRIRAPRAGKRARRRPKGRHLTP